MKRYFGGSSRQIRNDALAFFVIALLLFPVSPSVLCIAPGHHIAVEDINALCCAPSAISPLSGNQTHDAFDSSDNCRNCMDILLASAGSGVLSQSGSADVASPLDAEFVDTAPSADIASLLSRSGGIGNSDAPVPVYPSAPLRC